MSKKKHTLSLKSIGKYFRHIPQSSYIAAASLATIFGIQALLFGVHTFAVFRYETLYEQIGSQGATIQMPRDFLILQQTARNRSFFSRPDILAREIGILQSGTRSMVDQYQNDLYRLHDSIVQHIKYLVVASEIGEELMYPEQQKTLEYAHELQLLLENVVPGDIQALQSLFQTSSSRVQKVQANIEYAQKKLVLQDILAFKNEMQLIADMYRLFPQKNKILDIKKFWNEFGTIFSRENLKKHSHERLQVSLTEMKYATQVYRQTADEIRAQHREKRAAWVESEKQKWEKMNIDIPVSPLPSLYQVIHVSLAKQMMYMFEDNELILSTPITSGRNNYETIRGTFRVYTKQRGKIMKSPFPDEEYELWVDYWLWFHGAYGIHDACNSTDCWRTKFGGANYTYNGSHGCVNTPYNAVKSVYNWAKVGTTVYVR